VENWALFKLASNAALSIQCAPQMDRMSGWDQKSLENIYTTWSRKDDVLVSCYVISLSQNCSRKIFYETASMAIK
jgi:hypothetical protein